MNENYKQIPINEVLKRFREAQEKDKRVWLYSTTVEENKTEDAEFEIIQPKQLT